MTTPPPLPPQAKKKTILPNVALAVSIIVFILSIVQALVTYLYFDNLTPRIFIIRGVLMISCGFLWFAGIGFAVGSLITTISRHCLPMVKTILTFAFLLLGLAGLVASNYTVWYQMHQGIVISTQ